MSLFILITEHFFCICKYRVLSLQGLIHGIVDSENPSIVSQLTELTQKQLQLSFPTAQPPSSSSQSSLPSSSPGAKGGGGEGGRGEEVTIGEILGLVVAMFSLADEEQCVRSDTEMTAWRVSWLSL